VEEAAEHRGDGGDGGGKGNGFAGVE